MREAKNLFRLINLISLLLISEPLLKVMVLKTQTGLEWSLIWSNILENSQTFSRFFSFWLLSPLTGIFLLTYSSLAYALYFGLTLYKFYALMTYEAFTWPYMAKNPHFSAYIFVLFNLALMAYLFYPIIQRFILSRYLRKVWDARGRVDCQIDAMVMVDGHKEFIKGQIQNMSSGGVSLEMNSSTHQGDFLEVSKVGKIAFFDFNGCSMSYEFEVKSQRKQGKVQILGLEFLGLSPKEKIYLRSLLKEQGFIDNSLPENGYG
jgi:hypothetical protein